MTQGGSQNTQSTDTPILSGDVNRRNLLKGAAAVGVGAAAWAVPDITSLGGTPAYAVSCTAGSTLYSIGTSNTSCSCYVDPPGHPDGDKRAEYKPLNGRCDGLFFPGTAGTNIVQSGTCATGTQTANGNNNANAAVTVTPDDEDLYCKAVVRVFNGGACCQTPGCFTSYEGPIGQGTASLLLPDVPCEGAGNVFLGVFVECSTERECLL